MADADVRAKLRSAAAAPHDDDTLRRTLHQLLRVRERDCAACDGRGESRGPPEVLTLPAPLCSSCGGTGRGVFGLVAMLAFGGNEAARELHPAGPCPNQNEAPHCRYKGGVPVGCRRNYLCVPEDLENFVLGVAVQWGACVALVAVAAAETALGEWEEQQLDTMEAVAHKDLDPINKRLEGARQLLGAARRFYYEDEPGVSARERYCWQRWASPEWRLPANESLLDELAFLPPALGHATVYDWERTVHNAAELVGTPAIQAAVRGELVRYARFRLQLG